ncbi:conserved hypothetical protein [Ricinus communis]|uniref:Uncharacterized protein n=1 Tax=Ricinus communis TaxID=3988 RepID=B9S4X4_RICCO|nr:conserved hypothetical protein [Ricinus communis]
MNPNLLIKGLRVKKEASPSLSQSLIIPPSVASNKSHCFKAPTPKSERKKIVPHFHPMETRSRKDKTREDSSPSKKSKTNLLNPVGWLSKNFAIATITNSDVCDLVAECAKFPHDLNE